MTLGQTGKGPEVSSIGKVQDEIAPEPNVDYFARHLEALDALQTGKVVSIHQGPVRRFAWFSDR